jgi:hypothetical protein
MNLNNRGLASKDGMEKPKPGVKDAQVWKLVFSDA